MTLPSEEALRAAYDAAIDEIGSQRSTDIYRSPFYSRIADQVFDASWLALQDSAAASETTGRASDMHRRVHVVSAPAGAGKTTFSMAFITAFIRLTEAHTDVPQGCLFLVEQMPKADETYRALEALLPGKVAVWNTEHDKACTQQWKVAEPAARFTVTDLERYPVAVVTHSFYQGKRGDRARMVLSGDQTQPRALTFIDEQADQVTIYDVSASEVHAALEHVQRDEERAASLVPQMTALASFMGSKATTPGASLEKPSDDESAWAIAEYGLEWFATDEAQRYAAAHPPLQRVLGFARALATGYAFIARSHGGTHGTWFVGYDSNLMLAPGMVLLDATADIDGVTQLCPWRQHQDTPPANYENLSLVQVPSITRVKLSTYLLKAEQCRQYVRWMRGVIVEHMQPGQRGLVVCKKALIDQEHVPDWPKGDERFKRPRDFTEHYGWELEERHLAVVHWGGPGIGANHWKDADVVFLFDEFHQPARIAIATAQGLKGHKATEGALANMRTINARTAAVDAIKEGHLLRWTKQMALRGRARFFDAQGRCGTQKVVCTGDFRRLLSSADKLFPGAKITCAEQRTAGKLKHAEALLAILSRPELPPRVRATWIGTEMGSEWRKVGKDLIGLPEIQQSIAALGWSYAAQRGRRGSWFVRTGVPSTRKPDIGAWDTLRRFMLPAVDPEVV